MKTVSAFLFLMLLCACNPDVVYLSEEDSGREVILSVGQHAVITLPENLTTGYEWEFEIEPENQNVIGNIKEKAIRQETEMVGTPGVKEVSFKAENSGKTNISGYYVRSWEKWDKNTVQSVHYTIVAK